MADQAKGKEDKEDGEDYSEVIEVLKQYIKSHKRVIASQSSNIKTLLLSLNTLKASVEDSVSAIKNISSTLASLTNSSNAAAATIGKTSYSPRFDPFSSTMDLDSPPRPPRKEPYLGPAIDNTATSNLDPPIDTGSKEGFKDTITSSIVKELSKKAYTIPDDRISNFLENPNISNTYSDSDQAILLMLLRDSLYSGPRAAISWIYIPSKAFKLLVRQYSRPIESKKEDVYNEFHALTFSTYKKGLSAFNAEFNGYLAKLTMAKIDIDPSLILNQYFKALESKFPSWVSRQKSSIRQARMLGLIVSSLDIEYLMADILEESRNPAIEAYRAAHVANSSNSTPNSNSNPSKKGKNKKKGKKKASYNVEGQNYSAKNAEQASFILGSYNLAIEEEEEESDSSSNSRYKKRKDFKGKGLKTSSNKAKYKDNKPRRRPRDPALYNSWLYNTGSTDHISNSKERFTTFTPNTGQLRPINTGNSPISPASIGSITLEVLSRKAPPTYTKLVLDNVLYLPNIDINIVSGVRHYNSGGCLIKETLYRGDRRYIAILDFKKSGFFLNVKGSSKPILHANFAFPLGLTSYNTTKSIEPQRNKIVVEIPSNSIRKEDYRPIIEDAIVSEAIEPNKRYKLRNSPAKGTTLEGIGPSLRGKRPYRPVEPLATAQAPYQSPCKTREPEPLTGTRDLPRVLRQPVIEGNKVVEKAISSPTLKEPNIGQRDYYNLLNLAKLWHVRLGHIGLRLLKKTSSITKGLPNFDKIKEADFHCSSCNRGPIVANAIKGFFRGLRNGFGRYPTKFHFDRGTEITDLLTTWLAKRGIKFSTSAPYIYEQNGLVERSPTDNTALEGELVDLDLDLEGAISLDPSNLNTKKPISIEIGPSKLEPYKSSSNSELDEPSPDKPINPVIVESTRPTISIRKPKLPEAFPQTIEPILAPKPIEVIAPNQPITNEPLNNSNLISERDKMQLDYYKLLAKTSSYILSFVYKARKRVISKDRAFLNSAFREEIYMEIPKGLLDLAASNKAIYKLLLKYGYNPSTPNIIKLSKALYSLKQSPREWQDKLKILLKSLGYLSLILDPEVFYNAKTCHFIVTYVDDCLFIGPNIGYITDLKKQLNKVYAIEDLGPAAYFLGMQIIRDRPNRRL
ncbi:hypothetical protein P8C59_008478 [Phyllachora maydis]|uniref:Integrase catalytic domain-containing protein n=1 Tax=Phyllachora maydis TaxID=1825666 RepID=A0AAD9ICA1_9PEZI|nr:hypothetical protein P8C59_008478 [Phyllachora maydis]